MTTDPAHIDQVKRALAQGSNADIPPGTRVNFGERDPIQLIDVATPAQTPVSDSPPTPETEPNDAA